SVELPVEVADLPAREPVVAPRPELPVVVEAPVAIELPTVELPSVELPVEVADLPAREPVVAPRPELPVVVEESVIEEVVSVAIETRQPASLEAAADTSEFGYPLSFDFLVQMPLPLPAAEPVVEIVVDTLDDVSIATDAESIAVTTVETTEETSTELDDPAGIDDAIEYVDSAASVQSEVSATIPVAAPEDLDLNLDFGFEQLPAVQVDSIETQNVGTTDEEIELEQSPRAEDATIDRVEEKELRQDAAANLQIPTDEPVEEDEFELFYGLGAPSPAGG
ncbi:MAG: hypothetical protein KDA79_22750, partial [Planctomycetaceae bacterium]|nr:hypothetical protein [Planctomycetaceae bacterium]